MRLSRSTSLALAAGVGVALGYLLWEAGGTAQQNLTRPSSREGPMAQPRAIDRDAAPRAERATGERGQRASARTALPHPRRPRQREAGSGQERREYEGILERADRARARESLPDETVRELIEESLAVLWPDRTFSREDYELLTDAVLRVRAARRALREVPVSTETAEFVERQRGELTDALAQFEVVAGIPPSELPEVIDPDIGLSRDQEEDDQDEVQDLLSEYPPAR